MVFRSRAACYGCRPASAEASPASQSWRGRLAHSQPAIPGNILTPTGDMQQKKASSQPCMWMGLLLTSSRAESEKHLRHLLQLWGSHDGLHIISVCSLASVQRNTEQVNQGEQPAHSPMRHCGNPLGDRPYPQILYETWADAEGLLPLLSPGETPVHGVSQRLTSSMALHQIF